VVHSSAVEKTVAGRLRSYSRFIALAAVVVGLFALFIFVLPPILASGDFKDDADRLKAENDVRTTLLQALAGAFLLLGLYFTARTLHLNREGQITERFTKGIDQLGNETSLDVRLGGIYALQRIAKDSDNDRETIHSVLAAFIRQHAPRQPDKELQDTDDSDRRPREDVQVAATVLGRRTKSSTVQVLDLSSTDLYRVNLMGANLAEANFRGAYLAEARLRSAHLAGANLAGAYLEGAILAGANLAGAYLEGANLAGANLAGANLAGAILRGTILERAYLEGANLRGAMLWDAILAGADLAGANFAGAHLVGALAGAQLAGADLAGADLAGADLAGANLAGARDLDLGRYISELATGKLRFLDSQKAFLDSLSPKDLASFSLSAEDMVKFYGRAGTPPTLDSRSEGETGGAIT
jgi:uncharacterized protein YjbI with pentapeptide repeats